MVTGLGARAPLGRFLWSHGSDLYGSFRGSSTNQAFRRAASLCASSDATRIDAQVTDLGVWTQDRDALAIVVVNAAAEEDES